ncbi:MAG: DUF1365 domain-containing protein [Acidobacteria bacterium]|nr:DUF1365 domain-containing protein [Acidobacteriota bacterium]
MLSSIYTGRVRHRRIKPAAHIFQYRLYMLYLDLDELPSILKSGIGLSHSRFSPASFRRGDHIGDPGVPLIASVREHIKTHTGQPCSGPVRLLTQVRSFGYYFSPLNLYYCFDTNGSDVACILAEVTNTPWLEKHWYVLWEKNRTGPPGRLHFRHPKNFHVSPFMRMDAEYEWDCSNPDSRLTVSIADSVDGERIFDVDMVLERKDLTRATLHSTLARYPAMSLRITQAIYWQALHLWRKGCLFYGHP